MQNIRTGGSVNVWTEPEQKIVAHPAAGHGTRRLCWIGPLSRCTGETGACGDGIVDFLWSGFITLVAYIVLSFVLDPMPDGELAAEGAPTSSDLLNAVDDQLAEGEKRLREMERYITSDTFTLRSRFRQL